MKKSLAPWIGVFAVVIAATVIMMNTYAPKAKKGNDENRANNLDSDFLNLKKSDLKIYKKRYKKEKYGEEASFNISNEMRLVRKLLAEGNRKAAEDKLKTILVMAPDNMNALNMLGAMYFYSGRYKEAEFIFKRQIKIEPNSYDAYNHLASSLAKQDKMDEALKVGSEAYVLNPEAPDVNINLAAMYSVLKNKKMALTHLKKAAEYYGYAILILTRGSAFDYIRNEPDFIAVISKAEKLLKKHNSMKKNQK